MGDASDMADIERSLRSPEGTAVLQGIRERLLDKRIAAVDFHNGVWTVIIALTTDDETRFAAPLPEFHVDEIRESFDAVLDRDHAIELRRPPAAPG